MPVNESMLIEIGQVNFFSKQVLISYLYTVSVNKNRKLSKILVIINQSITHLSLLNKNEYSFITLH